MPKRLLIAACMAICINTSALAQVKSAELTPGKWDTVTSGTQTNVLKGVAQEPDIIYQAEVIELLPSEDRTLKTESLMMEPACVATNVERTTHTLNFDWTCPDDDVAIKGRTEAVIANSLDKLSINMSFDISGPKGQSKTDLDILSTLQPVG